MSAAVVFCCSCSNSSLAFDFTKWLMVLFALLSGVGFIHEANAVPPVCFPSTARALAVGPSWHAPCGGSTSLVWPLVQLPSTWAAWPPASSPAWAAQPWGSLCLSGSHGLCVTAGAQAGLLVFAFLWRRFAWGGWLYVDGAFPSRSATSWSDGVMRRFAGRDGWSGFSQGFAGGSLQALWMQKAVLLSTCRDLRSAPPNLLPSVVHTVVKPQVQVTLLRQGGWTRWPTEVPSNPYYSVILWFCAVSRADRYPAIIPLPRLSVLPVLPLWPSIHCSNARCGGYLRAVSSLSASSGCAQRVLFVMSRFSWGY